MQKGGGALKGLWRGELPLRLGNPAWGGAGMMETRVPVAGRVVVGVVGWGWLLQLELWAGAGGVASTPLGKAASTWALVRSTGFFGRVRGCVVGVVVELDEARPGLGLGLLDGLAAA